MQKFREELNKSAAAALKALSESETMEDFREVVKEMNPKEVNKLMQDSIADNGFGLKPAVQLYIQWLGEVRNERIASGAEALEGKLNWVKSGAEESNKKVVPKKVTANAEDKMLTNNFATWMREGPSQEPKDDSNMNCWEACLYAGFKSGAMPIWVIVSIYNIAKGDGQVEYDKGQRGKVVDAYTNAIAAVLGSGEETWEKGDKAPPRGFLVFFNGPSHVAVSRGYLESDDDSPAVMSLWHLPGPLPVMQATTIAKILKSSPKEYLITFGPAPW